MIRSIFILAFLGCLSTGAMGQEELAKYYNFQDSVAKIKQELKTITDPKVKVQRIIDLSFYLMDTETNISNLENAKEIAKSIDDRQLETQVDLELAMTYIGSGDYAKSLQFFDNAMPLYREDVDERTFYLMEYQYCKTLKKAGRYYESLERSQAMYDYFLAQEEKSVYIALTAQVIASIYNTLGKNNEAIEQYLVAVKLCEKLGHANCIASSWQSIGYINLELNNIEEANKNVQKASEAILNEPPLQWHVIYINLLAAQIKNAEEKPEEALNLLDATYQKVIKENWKLIIAQYQLQYAKAFLAKDKPQVALKYSTKALAYGNDNEVKSISKAAHLTNSLIFEKLGYAHKSLEAYRNFHEINESILSAEKVAQLNDLDSKYKNAVIQSKLNTLEKENALKKLEIEKGNKRKLILYGSAVFLSILLLLLLYFLRKKSQINSVLNEKNKIISKSLQDKDILLREIHHRVKNNLQVVSSLLNLQSNFISDDVALEAIKEGKNRVSSMALIHQNLYQEENLTSINSKEYFNELIDSLFDSYNIDEGNIDLEKDIDDLDIDVDTMIPLGLIVNELVSNALKHAFEGIEHKGKIKLILKEKENILKLTISDNGIGMSKEQFFNSDSFGNKMIKAFKQKLNAEFFVESDQGTSVSIHIKNYKVIAA